jgi:hypothetical protein
MYADRVLAYIDILGFSEAVEKTIKEDGTEDPVETQKIDSLLDEAQWQMNGKGAMHGDRHRFFIFAIGLYGLVIYAERRS